MGVEITEIIEDNFVAVAITLFLILFILTNNNFKKRTNRLFLMAACCVLILIVTEAWEAHLATSATYEPMRVLLSAIGYTLRPAIPFCLLMMEKKYACGKLALISAPLVFNTLAAFSALFCKAAFWYTPENEFVRGPLGLTPFLVSALYIGVLLTLMISSYNPGEFTEALILSAIVLLAFLSTVLESLFQIRFIQNPSIATSITFYYLFLHSTQSNRDPLTGALTRRRFYLDADKHRASLSAVISVDLNDLKTLNDQHGHVAGDKALVSVTNVMRKYSRSKAVLYRTGGDEFMLLCHRLDEESVKELVGKISSGMEQTPYRCAIGYAMYRGQKDFDAVCQQADGAMYENKRHTKRATQRL